MSDASDDELERIRQQKRERLRSESDDAAEGTTGEPVHVEGADHLNGLTAEGVVLVDFYADWCGPCKMLEPVVADVAETTDATVAKVDVDANQRLAREYSVQGVPTLLLFVDGEPVERLVGAQEEAQLRRLVENHA